MALACAVVVVVRKELLGFDSEFLGSGWEGLADLVLLAAGGFLTALGDREYFGLSDPKDVPERSGLRRN